MNYSIDHCRNENANHINIRFNEQPDSRNSRQHQKCQPHTTRHSSVNS